MELKYVNFLTLLLVNTGAGFVILAAYLIKGYKEINSQKWIPGFLICGIVSIMTGIAIAFFWPLPGSYNIAFGDPAIYLGVLFLTLALVLYKEMGFLSLGFYAFFSGMASVIIGIKMIQTGMTEMPLVAGSMFIFSGISGILFLPMVITDNKILRIVIAALLILAAMFFLFAGYMAYWMHLDAFSKWVPVLTSNPAP